MKKLLLIITIIAFTACNSQTKTETSVIDLPTLHKDVIGKKVQLVDVRTEEEYETGHIDDAVNINISDKENFKKQIQKLDKNKPVYIYCHSGIRSNRASKVMQELGFITIYDFSGGWKTWSNQ